MRCVNDCSFEDASSEMQSLHLDKIACDGRTFFYMLSLRRKEALTGSFWQYHAFRFRSDSKGRALLWKRSGENLEFSRTAATRDLLVIKRFNAAEGRMELTLCRRTDGAVVREFSFDR